MMTAVTLYKGVKTPLYIFSEYEMEAEDLKLYIYKDDKFEEIECTIKKIDDYFYRCEVMFDFTGKFYIRIKNKDEKVGAGIIEIIEDKIDTLYKISTGNWEIKNNQMIFKDRENNEIMRFDLFDEYNNPSMLNVFKRVRV